MKESVLNLRDSTEALDGYERTVHVMRDKPKLFSSANISVKSV